jgi:transcriptional regulator with XRE-family HTH domain
MIRETIIQTRKQLGYSQKTLAEKIGVQQPMISAFETRKRGMRSETVERIFVVLGLEVTKIEAT